ncbi:hypothetical protein ACP4OV_020722 [Aristida adscensionis]
MKARGCRNVNAVLILFAVLLGHLSISAHCWRELVLAGLVDTEDKDFCKQKDDDAGEICKESACSFGSICYCCCLIRQLCYKTIELCQAACKRPPRPPPSPPEMAYHRWLEAPAAIAGKMEATATMHGDRSHDGERP